MILQIFLYFFRRMVIRCFQCTHRRSQNFGYIFVFHFVEITHIKNEALFLRELQNRFLQKPLCTISVEIFVALYMREQEIIGIVGRKIPSFPFPCQKSQCLIHCNTIKPSRQFGIPSEILDTSPCFLRMYFAINHWHRRAKVPFSNLPI